MPLSKGPNAGLRQSKHTVLRPSKKPTLCQPLPGILIRVGEGNQNEIYIFITIIIIILSPIFSSSNGVWQDYRAGKLLKLRVMVPPGQIKRELQTSRCCRKPQHRKYLQNELRIYGGLGFSGFISKFHEQRREMEKRIRKEGWAGHKVCCLSPAPTLQLQKQTWHQ